MKFIYPLVGSLEKEHAILLNRGLYHKVAMAGGKYHGVWLKAQ